MKRNKVIVFDLGGTLMEYIGMPLNWSEYYYEGFATVNEVLNLGISEEQLQNSVEILNSYNPRISGREAEISPEIIFSKAISGWKNKPNIESVILEFFKGLKLRAKIYDYSINLISQYKSLGYKIVCLTDLPNAMPDCIFKKNIAEIIELLDLYVSSQSCGVRKPNKGGIGLIADTFGINVAEILFVGDEEKDLLTAENAGCDFMYINEFLVLNNIEA